MIIYKKNIYKYDLTSIIKKINHKWSCITVILKWVMGIGEKREYIIKIIINKHKLIII